MKTLIIFVSLLASMNSLLAETEHIRIDEIKAESDSESTLVSTIFKGKFEQSELNIEAHGTFIQVKIPKAIAVESGKFYEGNSPYFRKIAIFQINSDTVGVRLFATQETSSLVDSMSTDILKDRILIHLNHKSISKTTAATDQAPVATVDPAETNIEKNSSIEEILEPKNMTPATLKEKLIYTSIISAIFFTLCIFTLVFKKFLSRNRVREGSVITSPMRTLAIHPLAPKRNLTLVEVANQKILLAVSPEGINYLTTIDPQPPTPPQTANFSQPSQLVQPKITREVNGASKHTTLDHGVPKKEVRQKSIAEKVLQKDSKPNEAVRTKIGSDKNGSHRTIEDVTNLIRSKLKDLPTV